MKIALFAVPFVFLLTALWMHNEPYNGVDSHLGNLFLLSNASKPVDLSGKFQWRKGGLLLRPRPAPGQGRAARPAKAGRSAQSVDIKAKSTFTIAEIDGPGSIQHIWMTPTGNWRWEILRIYWDDVRRRRR